MRSPAYGRGLTLRAIHRACGVGLLCARRRWGRPGSPRGRLGAAFQARSFRSAHLNGINVFCLFVFFKRRLNLSFCSHIRHIAFIPPLCAPFIFPQGKGANQNILLTATVPAVRRSVHGVAQVTDVQVPHAGRAARAVRAVRPRPCAGDA